MFQKMRKSLGSKRKELGAQHIADITRLLGDFLEAEQAIVLDKDGKEVDRVVLFDGVPVPTPPAGGRIKRVPVAKVMANTDFGYRTITVERPMRDEQGNIVLQTKGKNKGRPQPDTALRDTESVPLGEDVQAYVEREVLPHVPDAWIDHAKTKIGYEIPLNRHFYRYEPPRPLEEIEADIKALEGEIMAMLREVTA